MGEYTFPIRPMAHMLDLSQSNINADPASSQWPSKNQKASSQRIMCRWDHVVYRTMDPLQVIQHVPVFRAHDGTYWSVILTKTDAAVIVPAKTFRFITKMFSTGTVTAITKPSSNGDSVVTATGVTFTDPGGPSPGDKFILDQDLGEEVTAGVFDGDEDNEQPTTPWAVIKSVGASTLTLTGNYLGTTGAGMTQAFRIRLVYNVPSGERWQYASVAGKFCFGNGNDYVQVWDGTGTCTDLNTTYARQARYLTAFADRLLLADLLISGNRNPWTMRWSKIGDPTDWTASSAGSKSFIDTEDPITGMASAGGMMFIYKKMMYHIAKETTDPTAPIQFIQDQKGTGVWAPAGLIAFNGTNAFMGLNDFYVIDGDTPVAIGDPIRYKWFNTIADTELVKVFGCHNARYHELVWVALTSEGQVMISYDYKEKCWNPYRFDEQDPLALVTGLGGLVY